jgi:hypothetical protein
MDPVNGEEYPYLPIKFKKNPFFCNLFHKAFILCKIRVAEGVAEGCREITEQVIAPFQSKKNHRDVLSHYNASGQPL